MRQSIAAEALICFSQGGENRWLARWNRNWHCFHMVGGHKNPEESFRDCVIREIDEELGLKEGRDIIVGLKPVRRLEYAAWSEGAKAETAYTVELFAVRLAGEAPRAALDRRKDVRWLTEREIREQRCADGSAVSPTMARLLDSVGWRCPEAAPPADG